MSRISTLNAALPRYPYVWGVWFDRIDGRFRVSFCAFLDGYCPDVSVREPMGLSCPITARPYWADFQAAGFSS